MERTGRISPLHMLRRHLRPVAVILIAGAAVGGGTAYLLRLFRPLYQAEAVINVLTPDRQESDHDYRAALADKAMTPSLLQAMLDPVTGQRIRETRWFRDILHEDAARAVACLRTDLRAVPQERGSGLTLSMIAPRSKEAALIATEAARLFISQQTPLAAPDEIGPKLAALAQQQEEIEKEIRTQDAALLALRRNARDMGVGDMNASPAARPPAVEGKRLSDLEAQENEQTLYVRQLESETENLTKQSESPAPVQIEQTIAQDPIVVSLTQQETALQVQLSGQLTRFGEEHRAVRQTKDQLDEVQGALRQRKLEITEQARQVGAANLAGADDKLRIQKERLEQLRRLRDQAQQRQTTLHGVAAQYEQLREKRDERIAALNQAKAQRADLRAMPGPPATMILELACPAAEPTEMVRSRSMPLWVWGGALAGLVLGIILSVLSETCNDVVRTPSDVRRFLNLPLLGVIPDAREDRAVSGIDPYHIVRDAPYSLLGEAYRYCRTNLDVSQRAGLKTLLIASGNAGDGKTSLACNLATAFAAKHETVLLIDANLRQPSLHLAFGRTGPEDKTEQRRMGLTSILTGQCDYQAATRTSRIAGLDLIYAGPPASHPAELLAGRCMKDLIENVTKWYDHVLIDSPPVLLVSDVKVLAGLVDATVLVFNAATTRRGAAQRTLAELQDVGAKVAGGVLFDVPALTGGYFRRQFKAYRDYVRPQLAAGSA